ncbi:MAG TPA: FHA domain-containing protein [Candidatus Obscuribacterales bacterium]
MYTDKQPAFDEQVPVQRPSALIDVDSKRRYELVPKDVISLGKDKDNDISLENDPAAHGCHALITFAVNNFWLEDLGTTCGTFLNDVRIEKPVMLSPGDSILVGRTRFRIE